VNSHGSADVVDFVDADKGVALFVHVFSERDYDVLDLLFLCNVFPEIRHVFVV
jgi:hypothetical protein